jgi:hypothetical protein
MLFVLSPVSSARDDPDTLGKRYFRAGVGLRADAITLLKA